MKRKTWIFLALVVLAAGIGGALLVRPAVPGEAIAYADMAEMFNRSQQVAVLRTLFVGIAAAVSALLLVVGWRRTSN